MKVEVVAEWEDGHPLATIRYDLGGLITSVTFCNNSNEYGCRDGDAVLVNALALTKLQ